MSKGVDPVSEDEPLADRKSMVWKGTLVASGDGLALVTATGELTEVGRIGALVRRVEEKPTPLELRLDQLGRRLMWLTLAIALVVSLVGFLRGGELWLMVETGLALAIAAVPEGLPAVATITLAVGMHRMARRRALVRNLPAVETLGSATVVCTDKTGTLTAGEMTARRLWLGGRSIEISGEGYGPEGRLTVQGERPAGLDTEAGLRQALTVAVLANRAGLEEEDGRWLARGDPTEAALLVMAAKAGMPGRQALHEHLPEVAELPFSSERMLMATFHAQPRGGVLACVKGAPRRVVELASHLRTSEGSIPLDAAGRERILDANRELAGRGLRVLALARKQLADGVLSSGDPDWAPTTECLEGLELLALVGMTDPPAAGVAETV
ncbi:MAG: HAD-IC family P-type ATPase, partial [Holophagales bacterium]|nr:HAD-IC family P-type ATPase [Holophagales bacterium]